MLSSRLSWNLFFRFKSVARQTTLRKDTARGICFRVIGEQDKDQVRQLCYEYWRTEELAKAMRLRVPQECETYVDLMLEEGLQNKVSFAAEDTVSGKLAGIFIGSILTPSSENYWENHVAGENQEKMLLYQQMLDEYVIPKNCFALYNVDQILFTLAGVTLPEFQNRGITTKLAASSLNAARKLGVPLALWETSSMASTKACLNLGFSHVKEVMLPQYDDPNFATKGDAVKTVRLICHMKRL